MKTIHKEPGRSTPSGAECYAAGPHAWLYDHRSARKVFDAFMPAYEELLLKQLSPGSPVLDLCCGTGWISQAVAERGFRVTGVDLALAMLLRARANAPDCRLLQADARVFAFRPVFAGALSSGEGINHMLNRPDLERMLANVHGALAPGGLYCFDTVLKEHCRLPPQSIETVVEEDIVLVSNESFDAATGRVGGDQILMYREKEHWQRCDVPWEEQLYPKTELLDALAAVGFVNVRLWDAERDLGVQGLPSRTLVIAQRRPA